MIHIPELIQLMSDLGVAQSRDLVGVSEQEIAALEKHFGIKLPQSYHLFLRNMGRSAGYLSPWMAIYFDDLKEIREQFDLLNATLAAPVTLPGRSVVIANWESVFDYMVCAGNDDPAVTRVELCNSDGPREKIYAASYSEYLGNLVRSATISEIPSDLLENSSSLDFSDDAIVY